MDIEAFSDDNFDAVAWINASFKHLDAGQSKDAHCSAMVSKLQLYVQQLNAALEDTSQQVLAGMPRIMRDAQQLQHEAHSLRTQMHTVQSDIALVQRETGACMEHLERLDGLQTKLRTAKQGLQESDGWGRLTAELDDLLEQSNLALAADKLQQLQKSLSAQTGLAGQSERDAQVEGFKNRIEALASPGVVDAVTSGDVAAARRHVHTFRIMHRLPQLQQYYRTVQRNQLQQHWTELLELNSSSGATTFVRDFYEHLVALWQRQLKWCQQVFGGDGADVAEAAAEADWATAQPTLVLCELLETMQPSREAAISACLKRTNDRLQVLQDASAANVWLVAALQKHYAASRAAADAADGPFVAPQLCAAVCDWFQVFVAQYATMEQSLLGTRLVELQLQLATSAETVRALGGANAKVGGWLTEARRRCEVITQDCGLPALVIVFGGLLKTFLDKYKKAQQQLQASRSIEQNWSLLQSCIALLQHIGDFHQQLVGLEQQLTAAVLDKHAAIQLRQRTGERSCHADGRNAYAISGKRELQEFAAVAEACRREQLAQTGGDHLFRAARDQIQSVCEYVHDTTLASVFAPVEAQMQDVAGAAALSATQGGELPAYSFAPQEFITEVGQYLLTLPQHLEPLLLRPSAALRCALELCDARYSATSTVAASSSSDAAGAAVSADVLLSLLVDETCAMYEEQIARIPTLSAAGAKQLATDVEYLGSVLEELGLGLGGRLQQTVQLLRASPETYLTTSAGCDPKLVTGIRQMRNIVSME